VRVAVHALSPSSVKIRSIERGFGRLWRTVSERGGFLVAFDMNLIQAELDVGT
jgi:hypothetical protein